MRNAEVAGFLDEIADLLELMGNNRFRVGAYRNAATRIQSMPESVESVWRAGQLQEVPGIGPSIAAKVSEWLQTGGSRYLEVLRRLVPPGVRELLTVPGLGPAKAQRVESIGAWASPPWRSLRRLPGSIASANSRASGRKRRTRSCGSLSGSATAAAASCWGLHCPPPRRW